MSHRQFVKDTLRESLKDLDLKELTGLELGAGNSTELKEFFEELGVKEWKTTDLHDSHSMPMENIDLPDKSYDIVFSCHAFEHCERPVDALKEMKRVARKYIILATPYHCEKQITNGDEDHIFVLTEMQMKKLFVYTNIEQYNIYTDKKQPIIQDWNLISIGKVE